MIDGTDYNAISVGIEELCGFQELVQSSLAEVQTTFDNLHFGEIPVDGIVGVTKQLDSLVVSSEFFVVRRPVELVEFVSSLNKHVIRYYGSVTDFFDIFSLTVGPAFASLSEDGGVIIPPLYIVP